MTITIRNVSIAVISLLVFALAFASFAPFTHALTQSDVDLICIIIDCDSAGIRDALDALVDDEGTEITRSLFRGISGDDVTALQEFLAEDPTIYPEGLVTGFFGSLTEAAVRRFQEQFGIDAVGIFGPQTRGFYNKNFVKGNKKLKAVAFNEGDDEGVDLSEFVPGTKGVLVCHKGKTIAVGGPAVRAHVDNHGDTLGACDGTTVVSDDADADADDADVDEVGTLKVIKSVVNNDGGIATADDFTFTAGDTDFVSGEKVKLSVGDYVLTEDGPVGYTAGDWGGHCAADGSITIKKDGDYKCTITNDDPKTGKITVFKNVINNDNGSADADDFTFSAGDIDFAAGVKVKLPIGDYILTEDGPDGYTAGDWGGHCGVGGSITIKEGKEYQCTITNNDDAPTE